MVNDADSSSLNNLILDLDSPDVETRKRALNAIGHFALNGEYRRDSLSPILEHLIDIDAGVRSSAALAVGQLAARGIYDATSWPQILAMLQDEDERSSIGAAVAVSQIAKVGLCDVACLDDLISNADLQEDHIRFYLKTAIAEIVKGNESEDVDKINGIDPLPTDISSLVAAIKEIDREHPWSTLESGTYERVSSSRDSEPSRRKARGPKGPSHDASGEWKNRDGYLLIFRIEVILRDAIQTRIVEPNPGTIDNLVEQDIMKDCTGRMSKEEAFRPPIETSSRWIDYCHFGDLKRIMKKGKNLIRLKDAFPDVDHLLAITFKLDELEPIRNKIAHSRIISDCEYSRLKQYADDIIDAYKLKNV